MNFKYDVAQDANIRQCCVVFFVFSVADTQLYKSLCLSVGPSVREHESKSVKTRISAPAHPSATGIGRVSGLVIL